jgi:hypothetical protein
MNALTKGRPMSTTRLTAAAAFASLLILTPPAASAQEASAPCLAVVLPSVQGVDGSAVDVATGLRDLFVSYLNGPALRAITLEARLPAQAAIEARQKGCDRMLVTTMVRKRDGGSRLGGVLGQAAGTAAWHLPYGAAGSVARGAAIAGAQAASTLAADTRRKDEVRLEYRLGTPDTVASAKPMSSKAKARSDGEDLLTPLVERASAEIFGAVTK